MKTNLRFLGCVALVSDSFSFKLYCLFVCTSCKFVFPLVFHVFGLVWFGLVSVVGGSVVSWLLLSLSSSDEKLLLFLLF